MQNIKEFILVIIFFLLMSISISNPYADWTDTGCQLRWEADSTRAIEILGQLTGN